MKLSEVLKNKQPVSHSPVPNRERKTRTKIPSKPGGEDPHFSQPGYLKKSVKLSEVMKKKQPASHSSGPDCERKILVDHSIKALPESGARKPARQEQQEYQETSENQEHENSRDISIQVRIRSTKNNKKSRKQAHNPKNKVTSIQLYHVNDNILFLYIGYHVFLTFSYSSEIFFTNFKNLNNVQAY